MIRGTTPTHTFAFEQINPEEFNILNIYYAQRGKVLVEKHKEDCIFEQEQLSEKTIYKAIVSLTQEETNLFKENTNTEIQLRVLTNDNKSMATLKYKLSVHGVLDDELLQ